MSEPGTALAPPLGQQLRAFREALGMSLGDLSTRSGMREPYLAAIEDGREEPSQPGLRRLVAVLEPSGATYEALSQLLRAPEPDYSIAETGVSVSPLGGVVAQRAASGFFWIAGLSVVNSLAHLAGAQFVMAMGLGVTLLMDAVVTVMMHRAGGGLAGVVTILLGLLFTSAVAGFFVLLGVYARKRALWPYPLGLALYTLDSLVFVVIREWFGAAFHGWMLWLIWREFRTARILAGTSPGPAG